MRVLFNLESNSVCRWFFFISKRKTWKMQDREGFCHYLSLSFNLFLIIKHVGCEDNIFDHVTHSATLIKNNWRLLDNV